MADTSSQTPPHTNPQQAWRALAALCVGLFLTLMDNSLVAVALPQIRAELDASLNQIVWVVAVYLLAFAVPLLVTGRLGDRFGQRNVYLVGMGIFVVGALLASLAPTIEWLIVFRAVQGLGGSLINPQPLAIINRIFPYSKRGSAMGVWSAVAGSAGLFGPVIGGTVVGFTGWRWMFAIYVPIGVLSILTVLLWVPRLRSTAPRIDVGSAIFSLVAVAGVVFGLQQGPDWGWNVWVWVSLVLGLVVAALFFYRQHALGDDALVPLELFRTHNYARGTMAVFALGFAVYPVQLPIMLYLQEALGLQVQQAAVALVPMGVLSIVLAPFAGRLTDKMKPGVLSQAGFFSLITAFSLFSVMMFNGANIWWILIPVVFLGVANALAWSPNSAISMRSLPTRLSGAGSGLYNTSRQVGAALGAATQGAILQIMEPLGLATATAMAMLAPIAVLIVGLLAVSGFKIDRD